MSTDPERAPWPPPPPGRAPAASACEPFRELIAEALSPYLDRWEERWADTRIHGTAKRQVAVMFAEEKPSLRELPLEPFRYYRYGERTVNLDGCIEVEAAYYGAPPGWLGRRVHAQWDELHVRILHPRTGQLLREHLRTRRGFHRIQEQDLPTRTPLSTEALLRRAHSAGAHVVPSASTSTAPKASSVCAASWVCWLARRHGPAAVDHAAQIALEAGAPTYRFVRTYLQRRPPLPLTLRQVDPLIRQLTLYRELTHPQIELERLVVTIGRRVFLAASFRGSGGEVSGM